MKIFSGSTLVVMIPNNRYIFLPSIIYVTCQYDLKEFCSHYKKYEEKDRYSVLLLKIDHNVENKLNFDTNNFTVILQKQ
jgi:hypothetical protein